MNLAEFHFLRPYWLLALLPAAGFFVALLRNRLGQGNWAEICDAELLPFILQQRNIQQSRWPFIVALLATLLTILALAGPTWERLPAPVFRNAAALVIALDLSASMDAADIKPSRLTRARYKIADILKRRKDGQTALLVYAGDAFTVTPLTEDNETIAGQLNALQTNIMPVSGSNTHAALQMAVSLLQQAGLQQGHILLISDGIEPDIIDQASGLLGNYRLSVLGVGTVEGAPVKMSGGGFIKDSAGNILVPKLDNSQLAALAIAGNGDFQSISANDSDIEKLLAGFDKPITNNDKQESDLLLEQWDEKGPWLLLLILPLAALSFRKGLLSMLLVLLLFPFPQDSYALEWRDLWQTNNQQAQHAFQQNDFDRAAEQFESPDWKAAAHYKAGQYQQAAETLQSSTTADGYYNQGNALAKAGQLQQALQAYEQSLKLDPQHADAKYNKEIVEQALQQQQQDQPQQGDDSQQSDQQQDRQNQEGNPEQSDGQQQQNESSPESDTQEKQSEQQAEQQAEDAESQAGQQQPEQSDEPADAEAQAARQAESSESEQATEQWLKRIPDDPSGLLKRKFRYQYGQRKRQEKQPW